MREDTQRSFFDSLNDPDADLEFLDLSSRMSSSENTTSSSSQGSAISARSHGLDEAFHTLFDRADAVSSMRNPVESELKSLLMEEKRYALILSRFVQVGIIPTELNVNDFHLFFSFIVMTYSTHIFSLIF